MKAAIGFLQFSFTHAAASSSAVPPISPIMIIASVSGSSLNIWSTSRCDVPLTGSPPIPTHVTLSVAAGRQLPDGLVGQGPRAGNHPDVALLVDVSGRNADTTATVGIWTLTGSDQTWTVRTDQTCFRSADGLLHLDHVIDRNAFGDADDQIEAGVDAFEDGVRCERRRNENDRHRRTRVFHGLINGIKDWHIVSEELPALSGRNSGSDVGSVIEA